MSNQVPPPNVDIILQYGDCILLRSKNGYLQSQGFTKPNLFLQLGNIEDPLSFRNFRDCVFQVLPRRRYEAFKDYNAFKIKHEANQIQKAKHPVGPEGKDHASTADEIRMGQLTKKLEEELKENRSIIKRRMGEQVIYGSEVELVHFDSNGLLEASKTVADYDKQCNCLRLVEQGSKSVCYIIEPRYRYRTMGQKVTYGDVIAFRNVKTDLFIHTSEREALWDSNRKGIRDDKSFKNVVMPNIDFRMPPNMYAACYEVNCSSTKSKFTLLPFRNFEAFLDTATIKGGQVIRLQHSETSAYVSSDDQDFTNDGLAEVFLWNYKGKSNDIESTTTNSLFELEIALDDASQNQGQFAQYSGNISNPMSSIMGGMAFRLRHLNTGRLVVAQEFHHKGKTIKTVGLCEHYPVTVEVTHQEGKTDKVQMPLNQYQRQDIKEIAQNSLFRLVSTGVDIDNRIRCQTSVQIQHVESKGFLIKNEAKFFVPDGDSKEIEEEKKQKEDEAKKQMDEELDAVKVRQDAILQRKQTKAAFRSMLTKAIKKDLDENDKTIANQIEDTKQSNDSLLRQMSTQNFIINTINEKEEKNDCIDHNLYKPESDANLNQGAREVLSFSKSPSFENAFFIYPEDDDQLRNVLRVHVSVNLMNSYIPEIASPDLGTSKERVKKIEQVLIELSQWLEKEKDFLAPDEQQLLEQPFSLEINEILKGRERRVQEKQRLVRELRVIESCVQILHIPFAKGVFNFSEITQDMAITSICKLTYQLMSKIVENYNLNQVYASQWINLYLHNILHTTEANQIGADTFLTMLSNQNKDILEQKFDREIIHSFISSCERSQETKRLITLLTALCSCQGQPISSNQTDIIQILFESCQENRDKFLMLIRKQRRGEIEVCLNLAKGQYKNLLGVIKSVKQIRDEIATSDEENELSNAKKTLLSDYEAFLCLIDLLSEAALGRNAETQRLISEKFELKIIQPVIESSQFPQEIRHRLLKLYLNLFLDKTFQKLIVPSETVIWNQLHNLDARGEELLEQIEKGTLGYPFKTTKGHISRAFYRMKEFCEEFLINKRGQMRLEDTEEVAMTRQVLDVILFMLKHGFYTDQEELIKIAAPVVSILDGSNDTYRVNGKDFQLGIKRYFPNKDLEHAVEAKALACDILIQISRLETDQKCSIILSKLKYDIEIGSKTHIQQLAMQGKQLDLEAEKFNSSQEFNDQVLETLSLKKGFESQDESNYLCTLFDLLLYRYPLLTQKVFELLSYYFLRTRTIMTSLCNVQVLESTKSIQTLELIKDYQSQLTQLQSETSFWLTKVSDYGAKKKQEAIAIFSHLETLCELKNRAESPYFTRSKKFAGASEEDVKMNKLKDDFILFDLDPIQPDAENQKLFRDFNLAQMCLFFINQRVDRVTINDPVYVELITCCYGFLVGYVRENLINQIELYEDLASIMRDSDKYQKATLLVYEIFRDNKKFLTLNVAKFVRQIVSYSEERLLDSTKKATYLKLLEVFCRYQDKLIRQNQSEIILQFTQDTARSNVLYLLQPEGAKELYQPLNECIVVHSHTFDNSIGRNARNHRRMQSMESNEQMHGNMEMQPGRQYMNISIFNVIQLIEVVTLCCQGKSEIAEKYTKLYILSFMVCGNMIVQSQDFWPVKKTVLEYAFHAFMDTADLAFLQNNNDDEDASFEQNEGEEPEESQVQTLLKIVENLNEDFEKYLNDQIIDHELIMPTGKRMSMFEMAEEYIMGIAIDFMEKTMIRKPADIGSFDMKFFDIGKNLASLYYKATKSRHKLKIFKLLSYMQTSENNSRYLSDVKHPAKKLKNNEELQKLQIEVAEEEQRSSNSRPTSAMSIGAQSSSTKSSNCSARILEIYNSEWVSTAKEKQFEEMVCWVVLAEQKIKQISMTQSIQNSPYSNVRFAPIISALLYLLDAQILSRELQLVGIKLIRKIVEVENLENVTPAADWESDDWTPYKRMIQVKQDYLVERGCVPFLCKLISTASDPSIREELILVCITLILGGNIPSQNAFIDYMVQEDSQNLLLLTVKDMLQKYFDMTKKYLTEKNAKLDLVYKIRKQKEIKRFRMEEIAKGTSRQTILEDNSESDDELLTIEEDQEGNEDGEEGEQEKEPQQTSFEDDKNITDCIRTLRFLQLLTEGHHKGLQNHLREQMTKDGVKSPHSYDFVACCSIMLGVYVKHYVNCYSTVLGNQLIEALVEFVQGPCPANQKTLVDTKVIDCCRDLLSQGSGNEDDLAVAGFQGKKKSLLDELKMNAVKLLLSIIEGTVDEKIYEKVSQSLGDFQIILSRMETLYHEFVTEELGLPANSTLDRVQSMLKSDSFDGQISEGFDIYDLLNQLGDVIQRDRERLARFENNAAYSFFKKNMGRIEIQMDGDLQIVFFIIQPKCRFLTPLTKQKFLQKVERETQQDKILGLLQAVPGFIDEMDHLEEMTRRIIKLPPAVVMKIRDLSTVLAVAIAFVIIWQYKYEKVLRPDGAYFYQPYIPPQYQFVMEIFGYTQLLSSSFLLIGFFINQKNLVVKEGWRKRIEGNQIQMQGEVLQIQRLRESSMSNIKVEDLEVYQARQFLTIEGPYSSVFQSEEEGKFNFHFFALKFEYYWVSLSNLINCGGFIFSVQYLAFSLQGLLQSPVFYAFHLLDVIERFPTLKDVIRSVTMNIKQLLMTAMLGVILIYLYGVIAFMFIPDLYFDEGIHAGLINKAGDSICMSLLHCFLSTFNYGLRTGGGMGEFLPAETAAEYNQQAYNIRFFFDVSFFLLVITILLNVIFGIIIDTFAELREKSSMQYEDMKNVCYICGLKRQVLEKETEEGFEVHTNEDHEVWNYVYFLIHLQIKDKSDMNGVESYIKDKFEMQETSWFPLHRCLRIIKEQRKKAEHTSETNILHELQTDLQKKILQAEEGLNNLENLLK